MRLGEINASAFRQPDTTGRQPEPADTLPAPESRALVPLAPNVDHAESQAGYRNVAFLAQLIATKEQHPQTRERRRAEPTDVLAAYRAAAALSHS